MLITMGDFGGMHKGTVSCIVLRVAEIVASLAPQYIKFPHGEQEMSTSKFQFHQIAKFPKVIGAIDCTHIRLQSPGMRMKLRTARLIIIASAVLHNIARERNDPEPEFVYIDDEVPVENDQLNVLNRAGDNVRQHLIHDYFARLL
ncbi:hypothetical protein C0J52_21421 [Blattella germanica]|nr:hypothetical protein C0J52_21421 [Blattella germanica]